MKYLLVVALLALTANVALAEVAKPNLDVEIETLPGIEAYTWDKVHMDEILAAAKDQKNVMTHEVVIDPETGDGWYTSETWESPYGRRWSETNLIAHVRDEHPSGANVVVITTQDRRYSIVFDGCGRIEKIAIGQKPIPQPVKRTHTPAPSKSTVVATPRPAPSGVTMICTQGCE